VDLEGASDKVMASAPVRAVALAATGARLRVLGYHGVERPDVLDAQLAWIRRHLVPVALDDVVAALDGTRALPRRAVWVTFDDGEPSVVEVGLPVLERHGVRATMFVCPSVIGTTAPLWWQGIDDAATIRRLKTMPDPERRRAAAAIADRAPVAQLTIDQLRRFATAGDIGNHTWDHPLLDGCADDEQRQQVRRAHEWLTDVLGRPPIAFAYPNGNRAAAARDELVRLGYRVAVLHDHRVARLGDQLALSRLRVGDHVTPARFAAVASGVHSTVHTLRHR
jgi:peptidoglycan/xylan/chitin deacetylase (PgdA/CDA1 family)